MITSALGCAVVLQDMPPPLFSLSLFLCLTVSHAVPSPPGNSHHVQGDCGTGECYRATVVMSNGNILLYSSASAFKYAKTLSSTEVMAFAKSLSLTVTDEDMQTGFGTCCDAYFDGSDEYITFGLKVRQLRVTGRDNAPVRLQSLMKSVDTFSTREENVPNQASPCPTDKPTDQPIPDTTQTKVPTQVSTLAPPTTTADSTDSFATCKTACQTAYKKATSSPDFAGVAADKLTACNDVCDKAYNWGYPAKCEHCTTHFSSTCEPAGEQEVLATDSSNSQIPAGCPTCRCEAIPQETTRAPKTNPPPQTDVPITTPAITTATGKPTEQPGLPAGCKELLRMEKKGVSFDVSR